jgi:hypothetical protein
MILNYLMLVFGQRKVRGEGERGEERVRKSFRSLESFSNSSNPKSVDIYSYCVNVNLSEIPALVLEVGICDDTNGLLMV